MSNDQQEVKGATTKGPAYLDQCILVEGIDNFTNLKGTE